MLSCTRPSVGLVGLVGLGLELEPDVLEIAPVLQQLLEVDNGRRELSPLDSARAAQAAQHDVHVRVVEAVCTWLGLGLGLGLGSRSRVGSRSGLGLGLAVRTERGGERLPRRAARRQRGGASQLEGHWHADVAAHAEHAGAWRRLEQA